MPDRILVTGANGFIGRHILKDFSEENRWIVRAAVRHRGVCLSEPVEIIGIGDLSDNPDFSEALSQVDVVVHTAAQAQTLRGKYSRLLELYRRINTQGTLHLAKESAKHGVRRFVFLSSIKVNGEYTEAGIPFTADDPPRPQDPYGVSKWQTEQGLMEIAEKTGMEVVIIRPSLVYGAGVKGNMRNIINWVFRGYPLPFGMIGDNKRSLVGVDNLVSLIKVCIDHPGAVNQVFLVADGVDLSTKDLVVHIAKAMGRSPRIFSVPPSVIKAAGKLVNRDDVVRRLLCSLQVDIKKTRDVLGWRPPVSLEEGFRLAVNGFVEGCR